jgi:hypothetical protein
MSRYLPGLDDDRLVGEALEALARETEGLAAPPALEARLRAAFREAISAPVAVPPARSSAWKWVAAVGAAAGLIWVAYASMRTPPTTSDPREVVRLGEPEPDVAPRAVESPAPEAPRVERVAAAPPRRVRRAARPEPRIERFEPLYPGDPLADLDAVHLMRVSVPRSALGSLGWPARPGLRDDRVELEAMVGPDGMTRAVRFISQ